MGGELPIIVVATWVARCGSVIETITIVVNQVKLIFLSWNWEAECSKHYEV